VKKYLIAIMCMFAFMVSFTTQAQPVMPAYVSVETPTMQAEDISQGKVTTAAVTVNKHRQSSAVAAVVKETTSNDGWEDRYVSIAAGPIGVHGGGTIGISKTS
jgi:phosphoenolpyruvate synthase/pyruvate phosphate dikinase